jgi:hypothetical protein
MTKRKYSIDEKTIHNRLKEGRGQGLGRDYQPWIKVHEIPSMGKSSIRKGTNGQVSANYADFVCGKIFQL